MIELTTYGDGELSLHVFNDEGLYEQRHAPGFIDTLTEIFTFTDAQRGELIADLETDLAEITVYDLMETEISE